MTRRVWIAGGTGYIGSATVAAARAAGWVPVVTTRSAKRADALRKAGVEAVVGDLEAPGDWERELRCDRAIFLAAPPTWGKRVSTSVARGFRDGLVRLTDGFLGIVSRLRFERTVYVAGTSFYGDAGEGSPRSEDEPGPPKGWGPYLAPAVERVEAAIAAGVPVILAFPGQVYGPASWNVQLFLDPIHRGKTVTTLSGHAPMSSPIHVEDCGRALVHLLEHGRDGRYLLVDDQPVRSRDFAAEVARALGRPLKTRAVPTWLCSLLLGPVLTEYATAHTNFSNARLKGTGFTLRYPTIGEGMPQVVESWLASRASA